MMCSQGRLGGEARGSSGEQGGAGQDQARCDLGQSPRRGRRQLDPVESSVGAKELSHPRALGGALTPRQLGLSAV